MNLWTFLDRNSFGIFVLMMTLMAYAFGSCGDHREGCKLGGTIVVSSDGGAR